MNKKTAKTEQLAAERLEVAKAKLLDGTIGAISVDTCIFTETGYRLDTGILKHLEQFKGNAFQLVFSEITIREIRGHIVRDSEEARVKLISALRGVGKYWGVQSEKQELVVNELLGAKTAKDIALKRLQDFGSGCGMYLIEAKTTLDIPELLKRYFNTQSPFESSAEKKSEFPDAIALLSLQAWAKKNNTAVLFVTKDKGCKRFCAESEHLYAVDDLSEALTLIQERDAHCSSLCKIIETKITKGDYPDLLENITSTINDRIWDIDWIPDASSSYYYEEELGEVEVVSGKFAGYQGLAELRAVDYRGDSLVVQTSIELKVDATCSFSFSVKDGFDHDMVHIGDATARLKDKVTVDVLLTFDNPTSDTPEIIEIELISSHQTLDFGSVEPDYSDEDPNSEYY